MKTTIENIIINVEHYDNFFSFFFARNKTHVYEFTQYLRIRYLSIRYNNTLIVHYKIRVYNQIHIKKK